MPINQLLDLQVKQAMQQAGIPNTAPAVIKSSNRPDFGDYQANGIMGAAKQLKTNPRQLAEHVVINLQASIKKQPLSLLQKAEVAGPGFINLYLNNQWLSEQLLIVANSHRLGIDKVTTPQTIVVDYSGPNLAKEMHVGHLRSTIIGDATLKVLNFLGHRVIGQNHVGDWGTQFGMLIAHLSDIQIQSNNLSVELSDLEAFYRDAKKRFDDDPSFAERARENVVKLQSGDSHCLQLWKQFIEVSLQHCDAVYKHLNVQLSRSDIMPESAYNNDLPEIIKDLDKQGLLTKNNGAQCVFMDEFKGKDKQPLPIIVQKSDGGYLYATTDLAALRYRYKTLQAERILYFVDARQSLHLKQVFALGKVANFVGKTTQLEHMPFGTMMGKEGKPFKTRAGGTIKLSDLLIEAEERALKIVTQKRPDLTKEEHQEIAQVIGIASVKYADLSKNRISDYIFNWDTMLSFEGNTAPYLLYAYARSQRLFRKAQINYNDKPIHLSHQTERLLAIKILQLADTLHIVAQEGSPHLLCTYLYELAGLFMSFYEACPILKETIDMETRYSRLQLTQLFAKTLTLGLDLLGIKTIDRM